MPVPVAVRLFIVAFVLALTVPGAEATTVVPPAFDSLVDQADYIVRGTVKSVNAQMYTNGPHRNIITEVEIEVLEVISGTAPQSLVLRLLGGKLGSEEMTVEGTPKFRVGDEDILFVRGNGRQFCPLVALLHGRYPIKHEAGTGRRYMTRGDGSPLANEEEVARPMVMAESSQTAPVVGPPASALTPTDFVVRIKATKVKNTARKKTNP